MSVASKPEQPAQAGRVKPPRSVTFLSLGVLTIAGFYAIRFGLALLRWQDLAQFPGVHPGTIAGVSLVMGGIATVTWWGLRRHKTWAPSITRLAAVFFTGFSWLERLYKASFTENGFSGLQLRRSMPVNWLFVLVLNLVGILLAFWILSRPNVRKYFGELHE